MINRIQAQPNKQATPAFGKAFYTNKNMFFTKSEFDTKLSFEQEREAILKLRSQLLNDDFLYNQNNPQRTLFESQEAIVERRAKIGLSPETIIWTKKDGSESIRFLKNEKKHKATNFLFTLLSNSLDAVVKRAK